MHRATINHRIDQAIVSSFLRRHKEVTISIVLNFLQRLTTAFRKLAIELLFQEQNFISLNTNIAGLTAGTTKGLVDHDSGMAQAAALSFRSGTEQKCPHAGCQTNTDSVHIRLDVLHGVKDAQAVVNGATRRIDIEVNVFLGIFRFKEEQLSNNAVRRFTGHRLTQKDDPLPQQPGINVEGPLAPARFFDHDRDHAAPSVDGGNPNGVFSGAKV